MTVIESSGVPSCELRYCRAGRSIAFLHMFFHTLQLSPSSIIPYLKILLVAIVRWISSLHGNIFGVERVDAWPVMSVKAVLVMCKLMPWHVDR